MTTDFPNSNASQVFISWSGPVSQAVAEALQTLIKQIMYSARPWISSKDIYAGSRWTIEIQSKLSEARYGVVCVTSDNLESKWIHFESGALSQQLADKMRVCPYLFGGIGIAMLEGPLSQFNAVQADKAGTESLLKSINASIDDPVEQTHLDDMFSRMWPAYAERLAKIAAEAPSAPAPHPRSQDDVLSDVLSVVRALDVKMDAFWPIPAGAVGSPSSTGTARERITTVATRLQDVVPKVTARISALTAENEALKEQLRQAGTRDTSIEMTKQDL